MTELEIKQQAVIDAIAAYDVAGEVYDVVVDNAVATWAADAADELTIAWDARVKARLELSDYLREQNNAKD